MTSKNFKPLKDSLDKTEIYTANTISKKETKKKELIVKAPEINFDKKLLLKEEVVQAPQDHQLHEKIEIYKDHIENETLVSNHIETDINLVETHIHTIEIKEGSSVFSPEKLTINLGDTVKWINNDFTVDDHLFYSTPGTNPYDKEKNEIEVVNIYSGQDWKHKFTRIGVYPYFCFIKDGMKGEITVVRAGQTVEEMKEELANLMGKEKKRAAVISRDLLNAKEMVLISGGKFVFGSPEDPTEGPVRLVELPDFFIDKYEVTNEEYEEFITSTDYKNEGDWKSKFFPGKEKYPVVNVSYNDAVAYATWAKKRLPTEVEWEKASRGEDHRQWPWGEEFDNEITNIFGPDEFPGTSPVGFFEEDVSPYGVYDMAGNVSEWTSSKYIPYEGSVAQGFPDFSPKRRVLRGGSFNTVHEDQTRTHSRVGTYPQNSLTSVGFRLVSIHK